MKVFVADCKNGYFNANKIGLEQKNINMQYKNSQKMRNFIASCDCLLK